MADTTYPACRCTPVCDNEQHQGDVITCSRNKIALLDQSRDICRAGTKAVRAVRLVISRIVFSSILYSISW